MNALSKNIIVLVKASSGANRAYSIKESILLAVKENRKAKLTHNEDVYIIDPEKIINFIINNKRKLKENYKKRTNIDKWFYMMDWCKENGLPAAQSWAWEMAKKNT